MPRGRRRRGGAHSAAKRGRGRRAPVTPPATATEAIGTSPGPADLEIAPTFAAPGRRGRGRPAPVTAPATATEAIGTSPGPADLEMAPTFAAPGRTSGRHAEKNKKKRRKAKRSWLDRVLLGAVVVVALALVAVGSSYAYLQYRFSQVAKVTVRHLKAAPPGAPFNVLLIGSDTRSFESQSDVAHFGTQSATAGQRSDVVKIVHIVPATGQASVISIPRDTMVTVAGDTSQSGKYNRINSTYGAGPDQLVQTIEADFGIAIEHVVQIDFEGFRGAVDAIGGITLDFPYPAKDSYTGLDVGAGCQHLNGGYSLAVARSRHYVYYRDGYWQEDPSSDFGRIQRQNAFLRALINQAEHEYNPFTLNAFVGSVVQGVTVDSTFTVADLVSLAHEFHTFSSTSLATATLPTYQDSASEFGSLGDVLYVDQTAAQPVISKFLGGPPETALTPPPGPYGVVPTTTTTSTVPSFGGTPATSASTSTTTTVETAFDPTPC